MAVKVRLKYVLGLLILSSFISIVSILFHHFYHPSEDVVVDEMFSSVVTLDPKHNFAVVAPDKAVRLPYDFAYHPEFQHEWWNYVADVKDKDGNQYNVQWSFFRLANQANTDELGWQNAQIYFSHIVIANNKKVWKEQRIARGGIGQSGTNGAPFRMWIDNWSWRSVGKTAFPGHLDVKTDTFELSLYNDNTGPTVLPGKKGYQQKHSSLTIATYNIQAPYLSAYGELKLTKDGSPIAVKGSAWMSKEWGSGLMDESQKGWDKFVIKLNDKSTLSLNRYRQDSQLPYLFGTLSTKTGKVVALNNDDITMTPLSLIELDNGHSLPLEWRIVIPKYDIVLKTSVINKELWLPFAIPYWQGAIKTTGTHIASGFMQLTGY